jgi:hypothetical protein
LTVQFERNRLSSEPGAGMEIRRVEITILETIRNAKAIKTDFE